MFVKFSYQAIHIDSEGDNHGISSELVEAIFKKLLLDSFYLDGRILYSKSA